MTRRRYLTGWVLLAAAALCPVAGAGSAYSAQACDPHLRAIEAVTGTPPHCSAVPPVWSWVAAAVLLLAALATLAPWWLRWLTGSNHPEPPQGPPRWPQA